VLAVVFPTRWAMAALGSSIGLHADKIGGDRLFGDDSTYHSTLYSVYSQADATRRLLLCWVALGAIILALVIVIGIFLKRKDVRA
jgi:ABC transport system ATP-binding/permease protein